jgi:hypothetical protein
VRQFTAEEIKAAFAQHGPKSTPVRYITAYLEGIEAADVPLPKRLLLYHGALELMAERPESEWAAYVPTVKRVFRGITEATLLTDLGQLRDAVVAGEPVISQPTE